MEDILIIFITILILLPICTLLHELGHVIPLLNKDCRIEIHVGKKPSLLSFGSKNFIIHFHFISGNFGYITWKTDKGNCIGKLHSCLIHAFGPLVSMVLSISSFIVIFEYSINHYIFLIIRSIAIISLIQTIISAVPMYYPESLRQYIGNVSSDGMKILKLFKK